MWKIGYTAIYILSPDFSQETAYKQVHPLYVLNSDQLDARSATVGLEC